MSTIPPEPLTPHEITAQAMMMQLRETVQGIAGYAFVGRGQRRKLNTAASLPDRFLQSVAVACDASSHLAGSSQITGSELRDTIAFARAYTSVADELEVIARGLRDTIAARRGDVGQRALRAYSMAKSINRPSDREVLIPHVNEMKRALGRGRRSKNTVPGAPPVAPAPPTAPAKPAS